ncbi:hypothetical protein K439DRAFT_1637944 [Ramaria rubella]|nr:hypothetical protein K439DRAFT_1637944 [Ramaria rubella]
MSIPSLPEFRRCRFNAAQRGMATVQSAPSHVHPTSSSPHQHNTPPSIDSNTKTKKKKKPRHDSKPNPNTGTSYRPAAPQGDPSIMITCEGFEPSSPSP